METRRGLTLFDLMAIFLVIVAVFAFLLPSMSRARKSSGKCDCISLLRQLGTYTVMYTCKYGSEKEYPPAPGRTFFQTLLFVPTPQTAIYGGDDYALRCPVVRHEGRSTGIDYRGPGPGLPGGRLLDGLTQPNWPIACDQPTNHDLSGRDDINILRFSGVVDRIGVGSPEWTTAINYTQ